MKKDSYFIGVKFNQDKTLYKKIVKHELNNSDLIRKSVKLYFRFQEPNSKIYSEDDVGKTELYNQDLVKTLQDYILDLKRDKEYLQNQNNALMVSSQPLLSRIIYKLKG